MTNIGFTGTQLGLTDYQYEKLGEAIEVLSPNEFHHGDCLGADAAAHAFAAEYMNQSGTIVIHQPADSKKQAFAGASSRGLCTIDLREKLPYLVRNKNIVNETEMLIACPSSQVEELRSGTWSTIRYARKLARPILMIYPWTIEYEGAWK